LTYKEFKKKLIDLDVSNKEFCEIFNIHITTLSKSDKNSISKVLKNYILLLEALGVNITKETLENK